MFRNVYIYIYIYIYILQVSISTTGIVIRYTGCQFPNPQKIQCLNGNWHLICAVVFRNVTLA